jgi:hypothetical protein
MNGLPGKKVRDNGSKGVEKPAGTVAEEVLIRQESLEVIFEHYHWPI